MLKRLSFTLTVTASLIGLYWMYALAVTPRLVPKMLTAQQRPKDVRDEPKFEPPPNNIQNAERFLPDASWAADAKFQIAMANGVLYTNTWRLVDEQQKGEEPQNLYEFRPFAMIWKDVSEPGDDSTETAEGKQPMTLMSESGLVQFSSKIDPVSRKSGRVIGGKLEGQVTASGPDGLTLRGRDFFFHEKSLELHSDSPVEFTYQQHRGTAKDGFKADLIPSAEAPRPDDFLAVSGIRRVTLRGQVEMDLANRDNPLHVTCDEAFQFSPEQLIASFQGNVNVQRFVPNAEPDLFTGDDILLVFVDDPGRGNDSTPRSRGDAPTIVPILRGNGPKGMSAAGPILGESDPQNTRRPSDTNRGSFEVREARMTGRRVVADSPSRGLSVVANSLVYDVVARTMKLLVIPAVGKSAETELKSVFVRHKPSSTDLNCPKLELTHDEAGQVVSAHGEGAGRMRRGVPDSDKVEFSAKWQQGFDLQQVADSEFDLLTLVGGAVLQQPTRETGLKAEQIQLWFDRPTSDSASVQAGASNAGKVATVSVNDVVSHSVPDLSNRGFRPRQLLAQDKVVVVSPQMNAETNRFIVNFDDRSPAPSDLAGGSKSRSRVRQAAGKSPSSKKPSSKVPAEPLQLSADLIRAKVRLTGDSRPVADGDVPQAELTEVWTEGNVDIQQPNKGVAEPLRLLGERLHLRNAGSEGEQVLHVFGQPARIRVRGFDVEGPEVILDRPNNRVWIDGAGELRMPVKKDPFDGRELGSPALLTVEWKENMAFDGRNAMFLSDVIATLKNSRLQCEEMEVVLTEQLSFRDDIGPATTAEVQRVICKDGVQIDQKLYIDDEATEIRHGEFANLMLDQTSGRMEGIGPGKIDLRRPGQGKRAALAPRAVSQANRPLESEVANLDFTSVTFQGKMTGNMRDQQAKFQDRVHIVYGPVAHPLDRIDPDHLPKDGGYMECDSLQIVQVKPTGMQKPHIELEAKGNAKLEGRSFNARADEITFDESKKLYTMRATGNRQVTIWRQTTPDGEPSEASAKSMRFIPSQNYLRSDQTTGIRGTN